MVDILDTATMADVEEVMNDATGRMEDVIERERERERDRDRDSNRDRED